MTTYLVAGGCGFIGSNFIHYILKRHGAATVVNLDALTYAGNHDYLQDVWKDPRYHFHQGNICNSGLVETIFNNYDIDFVVNFAAESHVDRSIVNPGTFVQTNIVGTQTLLEAAKQSWKRGSGFGAGKKFLQISTDEVYGSLNMGDSLFNEDSTLSPSSPYSASKAGADLLVQSYHKTYGLPMNITRCTNNFGPCQYPEKLIPLMVQRAMQNKPLPVYGDGMQIRDWLYVEDHCQAIELVLKNGRVGEIYNVGGCNERTNIQIVELILTYLNKDESLIEYVKDRPGHDRRYGIDSSKLQRELGWKPNHMFEETFIQTINWYKNKALLE